VYKPEEPDFLRIMKPPHKLFQPAKPGFQSCGRLKNNQGSASFIVLRTIGA
jgi:hypothetical protein